MMKPGSPKAHAQSHSLLFFIIDCVLRCLESHIFFFGGGTQVGKSDFVEDEPLCQGCVLVNAHNLHRTP